MRRLLLILSLGAVSVAQADPPLTLHYQERPPYSATGPDGQVSGLVAEPAARALRAAGIAFEWARTPNQRQLALIQGEATGLHCGVGWFRNAGREALGRFSAPLYRDNPLAGLVRDGARRDASATAAALLAAPQMRLLVKDGYSYGPRLDALIAAAAHPPLRTSVEPTQMARMLVSGRADWMLVAPEEASLLAAPQLRLLPLADEPKGQTRHLYCSRAVPEAWIARIDRALATPPLMRLPHLSLRGAVLAAIVAGVLLPAGLVIFIGDFAARQSQQPVIDRTRGAVVALATAALTEPAWTLSTPGLQAAIANILREPSVCGVEVLDLQPTIDAPEFRRLQCATTPPAALREAPVRYEGQTIARVRVHFDDSELDRLLLERRLSTLWLVALQVLAGGLVIAGLMSSRLVRPIEALKRQADSLTHRQPGPLPDWSADDELGQLGRHLTSVHTQVRQLIDELEHKNEALRQMALHDALTGLPNRTLLRELFTVAAAQARRDGGRLVLMFVDLDHFKAVNDTHGHAAGDALLQVVARRLRQCLREADVVCRMAGDEFLVLMPDCDDAAAELAAVRIINHLREPQPLPGVAEALRIGSSIGIARFPDDAPDFDALVHAADVAMYRSKQLGRARHGFYHADMDTELRARRTLERELADAIDTGQLRLHYQPLVDPHDGRILGAEALVRWAHPTRGLLAADAFIEAAEACGLVVPLGQWVLETACAQLAAWRAAGKPPLQVAINVSALQLRDEDFPARVADAVQRHGLPHHALELELTEVTLLADGDATQRAVAALRAAGVRLAVDDFGCGYSSLATLKMLQPDRMKIDRSFVRDLPQSRGDGELVQAMFGMARALDVEVVAEGVETGAHRAWLLGCGPHLQQGWLWARALPADEFAALLPALPVPVS